jgi:hypothetical protein
MRYKINDMKLHGKWIFELVMQHHSLSETQGLGVACRDAAFCREVNALMEPEPDTDLVHMVLPCG